MGSAPEDLTLHLHACTIFLLSHYIPPARQSVEVVVKTKGGTFMKDDGERRVSSERQITEGAT